MHRHSPLMRSLLLQFQTPTAPRRAVGFFGSGRPTGCPAKLDHSTYFGLAKFYFSQPFRSSTRPTLVPRRIAVNACFWCTALFRLRGCLPALLKAFGGASGGFPQGENEGSGTSKAATPWRQSALAAAGLRLHNFSSSSSSQVAGDARQTRYIPENCIDPNGNRV